jgi:hypothetical protein
MDGVNLRGGPGPAYPVVGSANAGNRFPVVGQVGGCAWLQIMQEDGSTVWLTGAALYTRLSVDCGRLAAVKAPAVEAAAAGAAPTAASTPAANLVAPTPRPTPAAAANAATVAPTATATATAPPAPAAAGGPTGMAAMAPGRDAGVNGAVVFAWTPNAPLAAGQVYELVFWNPGESYNNGRALNAASANTSVQVNVDSLAPGPHSWGVFLANADPYSRVRYLGDGGTINVTSGGDSGGDGPEPTKAHSGGK